MFRRYRKLEKIVENKRIDYTFWNDQRQQILKNLIYKLAILILQ